MPSNTEHNLTLTLPIPKNKQQQHHPPSATIQAQNLNKTKRLAISAEPAQLNKKSKDLKTYLKEYEKSDEFVAFLNFFSK